MMKRFLASMLLSQLLALLVLSLPAYGASLVVDIPDGCTLRLPGNVVTCGVVVVDPPPTPAPTITNARATPSTVTAGGQAMIDATVLNAKTVQLDGVDVTLPTPVSPTATRTYTVTARGPTAPPAQAQVTVTVAGVVTPPPTDFCGAFPDVVRLTQPWGNPRIYPGSYGGVFRDGMVLVVAVPVPASPIAYASNTFSATTAEYVHQAVWAHVTLSRFACDFRESDPTGANGPISQGYTASASVYGSVPANMTPGQTYYVNVKWLSPYSCSSTCASLIGFQWPR